MKKVNYITKSYPALKQQSWMTKLELEGCEKGSIRAQNRKEMHSDDSLYSNFIKQLCTPADSIKVDLRWSTEVAVCNCAI